MATNGRYASRLGSVLALLRTSSASRNDSTIPPHQQSDKDGVAISSE